MTRPVRSDGSTSSRCSTTGTATLYGRFATSAVGGGPGTRPSRSASACTTVEPAGQARAAGRRPSRGSAPASTGSISTAVTRAAGAEQAEGQRAEPGPDLEHDVVRARAPAVRTIRRIVFGSCRKFCPSDLVGRDAEPGGQRADLRRPQQPVPRHRAILPDRGRYRFFPQTGQGAAPLAW